MNSKTTVGCSWATSIQFELYWKPFIKIVLQRVQKWCFIPSYLSRSCLRLILSGASNFAGHTPCKLKYCLQNSLTYYPVDIVRPRSSFTTSASVRSSIFGKRFESARPRCAPATVLYSHYSIATLFGHQSAFSDGVSPPLVVSSQQRAFAVQLRDGAAGGVLETTNSLNFNKNKRKSKHFNTNFVHKCT